MCVQVNKIRTITSEANSLMQAGSGNDAFPVQAHDGTVDVLWIIEIERSVILRTA